MQKITVIKTLKESFSNVLKNIPPWTRLALAPLVVWTLGFTLQISLYTMSGKFSPFDLEFWDRIAGQQIIESNNLLTIGNVIFLITSGIAEYGMMINFYRYAALNERGNYWWTLPLNSRLLKMIIYTVFFAVLIAGYALCASGVLFTVENLFANQTVNFISVILLGIFALYLLFRIFLSFLLIAIDDRTPIKTSWRLMQGNVLKFTILLAIIFSLAIGGMWLLAVLFESILMLNINIFFRWLLAIPLLLLGVLLGLFWIAVTSKALALVRQSLLENDITSPKD